jgi:hypothetical protein
MAKRVPAGAPTSPDSGPAGLHPGYGTTWDGGYVLQRFAPACLILAADPVSHPGGLMKTLLIPLLKMLSLSDNLIMHD